jgi:predicted nucleic acid-binding protein
MAPRTIDGFGSERLGDHGILGGAVAQTAGATDHARDRADVLAEFARWVEESFTLFSISSLQCRTTARFADQHALGLRAGDALHLAVCADQGATLCTLDRRLGKGGPSFGVKTTLL